jgi:hypothetical protein
MIPTFKRVIKRKHCIYTHEEIDDILAYITSLDLPRGVITKICRDTGIPESILLVWHASRMADDTWFPLSKGNPQAHHESRQRNGYRGLSAGQLHQDWNRGDEDTTEAPLPRFIRRTI